MNKQLLAALHDKGFTLDFISVKTGIPIHKLRSGELKEREYNALLRLADFYNVSEDEE